MSTNRIARIFLDLSRHRRRRPPVPPNDREPRGRREAPHAPSRDTAWAWALPRIRSACSWELEKTGVRVCAASRGVRLRRRGEGRPLPPPLHQFAWCGRQAINGLSGPALPTADGSRRCCLPAPCAPWLLAPAGGVECKRGGVASGGRRCARARNASCAEVMPPLPVLCRESNWTRERQRACWRSVPDRPARLRGWGR